MNSVKTLENHGQAIWLDFLARGFVAKGDLQALIDTDKRGLGDSIVRCGELYDRVERVNRELMAEEGPPPGAGRREK